MHKVEISITIRCPKLKAYNTLKEMERFPEYMKFVKNIKVLERSEKKFVTFWQLEIDGAPLTWRQEDYFDPDNFEIKFKMLEGDYQHYEGGWKVLDFDKNHCRITAEAQFDWGIPVLEAYVKKTLERKAKLALGGMLRALKNKLESENV